ncbi:MAG: 7-cyano-7-deazaguanine synthase QueC [Gammaproteobacteria bacterium]|nr:MAG: 7-cyano-7-deazaguanine synthase QueC [Gammaproteobacteria bacterium]RLA54050.1 MAG: 7-cyano-7-deazaguanine synthase QueC [Gammaproteobacteria bacterium]
MAEKKAVVLVSGGLDSATVLAIATNEAFACHCLAFDYGQRHRSELDASLRISDALRAGAHKVIKLDLQTIGGSALTDDSIAIPEPGSVTSAEQTSDIPITYVPARNTIFLSIALGWAEVLGASDIFIGVNAVDYSGYPDCRPEYIAAFEQMANLATRASVEGQRVQIHTPLISMTKEEIIKRGTNLGVDYGLTVSCYQATASGLACGRCESCLIREQGFHAAGIADPTHYK